MKVLKTLEQIRNALEHTAVDLILMAIGLAATYLSVKYTYEWQVYTGDSGISAMLYSLIIVGFSIIAFEFAVQAYTEKKKRSLQVILAIAWLIVAFYSMQSTVAGQYIGIQKNKKEQYAEEGKAKNAAMRRDAIDKQLKSISEQRERLLTRNVQLLSILDKVQSAEDRKRLGSAIVTVEKEYKESQGKMSSLDEQERILLSQQMGIDEGTETGRRDIFEFYTAVLKVKNPDVIEFTLAVFKGVILDSVNILCFMFVMLRRKKKEGDNVAEDQELTEILQRGEQGEESTEEEAEEPRLPLSNIERIAEEIYRRDRKSSRFVGPTTARKLGISKDDYAVLVRSLVRTGTVIKRKGILYINPYITKEELIREGLTAGL